MGNALIETGSQVSLVSENSLARGLKIKRQVVQIHGITGSVMETKGKVDLYRVSQEEWTKLRESVPYVKLYRYNPKHLYPKLNGYGDNGQRKVWTSCISA